MLIQIATEATGGTITKTLLDGSDLELPGPIIQGTALFDGRYKLTKNGWTAGGHIFKLSLDLGYSDVRFLRGLMEAGTITVLSMPSGVYNGFIKKMTDDGIVYFQVYEQKTRAVDQDSFLPTEVDFYRAYIGGGTWSAYDAQNNVYTDFNSVLWYEIPARLISISSQVVWIEEYQNWDTCSVAIQVATDLTIAPDLTPGLNTLMIKQTTSIDADGVETQEPVDCVFSSMITAVSLSRGAKNEALTLQAQVRFLQNSPPAPVVTNITGWVSSQTTNQWDGSNNFILPSGVFDYILHPVYNNKIQNDYTLYRFNRCRYDITPNRKMITVGD